jgi:predicted RNA-binding protein YlqC (UPF0109 family)
MNQPSPDVCALVEHIAKRLVEKPDEVAVEIFDDDVLELTVAESDMGRVIGRQGRTAKAMRTLVSAAGARLGKNYDLEILE